MAERSNDILRSFGMNLDYCRALLADVPEAQMAAQPLPGMNHAAWIAGHLAHSFQAIGGELGIAPWLPHAWDSLFATGSRVSARATDYPPKSALVDALEAGAALLAGRLQQMSDADFARPLPDVRYRHVLPTLGAAVLQILVGHAAVHLGQLSAWRRAVGLHPAPDPL